jgi:hypothetical protein
MPNFEITFAIETVEQKEDKRVIKRVGSFRRIVSLPSEEIAEKIAEAMLGEEVLPVIYLGQVLSITKTKRRPYLGDFCDCYIWERVLRRLRPLSSSQVSGQDAFDGFKYFSPNGSARRIRVGLRLNKAQRDRFLSIPPSTNSLHL